MRVAVVAITATFASFGFLGSDAARADEIALQSADGSVTVYGSYGLTAIKARELVYEGDYKVSELIWKSNNVQTLNAGITADLTKDFYLQARGSAGFDGNGHMVDYDWLISDAPWSDRSLHPDTRLNHYFTASVEIGRTVVSRDQTDLQLGAGFKYTDVKWTAWGGSYVYSGNGFRDLVGDFDPNSKGISYRQSWPVPYLGANLTHRAGAWTFSGALQAGLAVNARDVDDHWQRNLRFYDDFDTTPTISLSASADYQLNKNASFYLSGSFDRMFTVGGDTKVVNTVGGGSGYSPDGAGGDFRSMSVSLGVRGRF